MTARLSFQGGTLVLADFKQSEIAPAAFQWIKAKWRCEAYHYPSLIPWLRQHQIRDVVPRWQHLDYSLQDARNASNTAARLRPRR